MRLGNNKESSGALYTVEQVADLLGLHVKTVRGYVRAGKLPATRIGKAYRIAAADVAAFTGTTPPAPARMDADRVRRVETTAIVQVTAASPETLGRVEAVIGAAALEHSGEPLRVHTFYDEERAELRVVLIGAPRRVATVLGLVDAVLEQT